ncbi:MAG: outer membrane beta-barrel protein, partial [Nitrososphaeraceae archaeon]|nr:outer membrane beta-barrel protein [Nitrososphaeraceae archaeon]
KRFNLNIRPRYEIIDLSISNSVSYPEKLKYDRTGSFGLGLEFEFILPFNNSKWAITLEPIYSKYSNELYTNNDNVSGGIAKFEVDYSSLTLPLSLRYYFYLNEHSKIFLNASYITNFKSESNYILEKRNDGSVKTQLEIVSENSFSYGVGYKYQDKFIFEFRYLPSKDLLNIYSIWNSEYSSVSFIIGYTLF